MDKPDFNSDSWELYNSTSDNLRREGFQAGCDHVWNTHVVPLQSSVKASERFRAEDAMSHMREANDLRSTLKREQESNKVLIDKIKELESKLKVSDHLKELDDDAIVTLQKEIERLKIRLKGEAPF